MESHEKFELPAMELTRSLGDFIIAYEHGCECARIAIQTHGLYMLDITCNIPWPADIERLAELLTHDVTENNLLGFRQGWKDLCETHEVWDSL